MLRLSSASTNSILLLDNTQGYESLMRIDTFFKESCISKRLKKLKTQRPVSQVEPFLGHGWRDECLCGIIPASRLEKHYFNAVICKKALTCGINMLAVMSFSATLPVQRL